MGKRDRCAAILEITDPVHMQLLAVGTPKTVLDPKAAGADASMSCNMYRSVSNGQGREHSSPILYVRR